jgi:dGTPase
MSPAGLRTREDVETEERERLARWAMKSADSAGRRVEEPHHAYRTAFQRDRDRVIHSTAFRRLEYKTQVFVFHEGDHYRNRLTHTIEGGQIARSIARALRANEDLAEAVVLAHDLGHPPFGHACSTSCWPGRAASTTTARPCASSIGSRSATRARPA